MALTVAIEVQQSALAPENVTIVDDSGGVDAAVTQRRIYITDTNGNYLVPTGTTTDYIEWPDFPADTEITLNILTEDTAVSILVQWLNVSNVVLYSLEDEYCLAEYNKQFFFYLFQQQALVPGIVQDANYYSNLSTFWANVQGAITAVTTGDDIASSQNALNRATYMRLNQNLFF